jgi:ABC-type nitrate/sulfonate/bicarbonate transport system substrate-binding protein
MQDMAKGLISGKLIGELTDSNNYVILGVKGISDIKQLKGKAFGISSYNGGDQLYAQAALGHFGLGLDDLAFVPVGVPTSRMAALVSGRIDATVISEHQMPENALDKVRVVLSAEDSPVPFVSGAIFARQDLLSSNKPLLQKFLAAIGRGADWARTHPDDAMAGCQDSGSSVDACKIAIKVAMSARDSYTWSSTTRVNADAIKAMIPLYAEAVPQLKGKTVADFVDTTVAEGR